MEPQKMTPVKRMARNTVNLFKTAWATDRVTLSLYFAIAALSGMMPLATNYALKLLIDNMQEAQKALLPTVPIVIVVILAARYLVSFIDNILYWGINKGYLDYVLRYKLQNEVAHRFQTKVSGLDVAYFEKSEVQDLLNKTRDTMLWRIPDNFRYFSDTLRDVIAFLAAFLILMPYGWYFPILMTAITLPRLYLNAKYGAITWSIWGSGAPEAKKLWYLNYVLQDPVTVREMRISQSAAALLKKFKSIQEYLYSLNKKALDKYFKIITMPPFFEIAVIFAIAYSHLPSVMTGVITIGSFTLFIGMLEQLGNRAAAVSSNIGRIYENSLYIEHYFDVQELPPLVPVSKNPIIFEEIKPPRIEFRKVSFSYGNGPDVLHKVSFTIEPGESVAFVGENGAGKTTIVKLLCRFYDVTAGEILINGVNIKELDPKNWYKFLGTLFQEFVRYHFTVRENITMGAPDRIDDAKMITAAKKSGAAEFIETMPNKYEQILGKEFEDGQELSGGQWQKIAIARAFYEEAPVLILDEPTSAIDAKAEYDIFSNLEKQYKNKTLVLVSHRFSTVRNANKIIVIEKGKVAEQGTHKELLAKNGRYAKLFAIQAKGYK